MLQQRQVAWPRCLLFDPVSLLLLLLPNPTTKQQTDKMTIISICFFPPIFSDILGKNESGWLGEYLWIYLAFLSFFSDSEPIIQFLGESKSWITLCIRKQKPMTSSLKANFLYRVSFYRKAKYIKSFNPHYQKIISLKKLGAPLTGILNQLLSLIADCI